MPCIGIILTSGWATTKPVPCWSSWSNREAWSLPMKNEVSVRIADWQKDNAELRRIREAVFINEQSVPPDLEWDSYDQGAIHLLACAGDDPIGTARLLADGDIGRVAVLKDWRGSGVVALLMKAAIEKAEQNGLIQQFLTAQVHATPFYERLGF